MKPKTCRTCGREFVPDHPARLHCGLECRLRARREKNRRWKLKQKKHEKNT